MDKLIEKLKLVKDNRKNKGKRHELWVVLLIIILGIMAKYVSYRAIGDFAKNNHRLILKNFGIRKEKLPSYSTIRRVIIKTDSSSLLEIFNEWGTELKKNYEEQEWLSIDGKSLKNTVINYDNSNQNFMVFTSLFSQETGLVLQLQLFENKKESEIGKFQELVAECPYQNQVFTGDSLHCQKQTVSQIIETKNDYLLAVKKNQKKLYEQIQKSSETEEPISIFAQRDQSHGRDISRKISVFKNEEENTTKWQKIKSLIKVERTGMREDKQYEQISYYISSLSETAQKFAEKIRGHWHIENQLHWVKDVILGEDDSQIHDFQAATNFSILETIALNLFRILGFLSITEGQRWLGTRVERLSVLLE